MYSLKVCFNIGGIPLKNEIFWILMVYFDTRKILIFQKLLKCPFPCFLFMIYIKILLRNSLMSRNSLTAQKIKFSLTDFFSKCDQIRRKLRIWSHLLKKSVMENFIFCAVSFLKPTLLYQRTTIYFLNKTTYKVLKIIFFETHCMSFA